MTDSKMCTCCECGYVWQRGQDGSHHCATILRARLDLLLASATSFAIGDVVKFKYLTARGRKHIPVGDKLVISDSTISCGYLQYAINGCAWYEPEYLELVSRATPETLQEVIDAANDENDEDLEEIDIEE